MTDRPWMTALEMQFAAVRVLDAQGEGYGKIDGGTSFQSILRRAETFAWTRDTATAVALASRSIPRDATMQRTALPESACGWWWFDSPVDVGGVELSAIAFGPADDGQIWFQAFVDMAYVTNQAEAQAAQDSPRALARARVNRGVVESRNLQLCPLFGWSFECDTPTIANFESDLAIEVDGHPERRATIKAMGASLRIFLAGCAWLQQRIVTVSSGHVERHRRKQLTKEHDAHVTDVKIVQLRRVESQAHMDTGDGEPVEWSCRWIVNGHWRNQYHPSSGKHELKYILPYVKGPADKPLKVPTHTVYSVNR